MYRLLDIGEEIKFGDEWYTYASNFSNELLWQDVYLTVIGFKVDKYERPIRRKM